MPPYKFDSSRAWGRHYGQDFGGAASFRFLNVGAVGAVANNIMFSRDGGVTWSACVVPSIGGIWGMAYSPALGYALATSPTGGVVSSVDGQTWALVAGEDLTNGNWRRMVRNKQDTLFVIVGLGGVAGQRVATSPDGVLWTLRNTPNGPNSSSWTDICVNPVTGRIWCITSASSVQPFIFSDDGGITWAYGPALAGADGGVKMIGATLGLASGYMRFTGGGTADIGDYFSTNDGTSWQFVDSTPGASSQGVSLGINEDVSRVIRGNVVAPGLIRAAPFDFPPPAPWTTVDNARTMANPSAILWSTVWAAWIAAIANGTVYRSADASGGLGTWSTNATALLNGNASNILSTPFPI